MILKLTDVDLEVQTQSPLFCGLRMSADEFFAMPDNEPFRYELVDGVVLMTPSPSFRHQDIVTRIAHDIASHLDRHPVGKVCVELDIQFEGRPRKGDLVYRPDVVFLRTEQVPLDRNRVRMAPAMVVEVISPLAGRYDRETKMPDYARCGVLEYWLIDPLKKTIQFYRLSGKRYVEIEVAGDKFASEAVPGFVLDLQRIRSLFEE